MKTCSKCKYEKDLLSFGYDRNTKDGLNYSCKQCIRIRSKNQKIKNPEYAKKYAINYRKNNREKLREKSKTSYYIDWEKRREQGIKSYNKRKLEIAKKRALKRSTEQEREKNRIRQRKWRERNKSHTANIVAEWKKRNPQKSAAHSLVLYAIRTGIMKKPEKCEECNMNNKLEAHHNDYLKPLEVNWLCKNCHANKHKIYR